LDGFFGRIGFGARCLGAGIGIGEIIGPESIVIGLVILEINIRELLVSSFID
jgi:hypothetical protein